MNKPFLHLHVRRYLLQLDLHLRYHHLYHSSTHQISTSRSSPVKYNLIEDTECLERYMPGGYHPVHIGDQFHNRYRVVHKLGYGAYSTTWLARDQKTNKLVAVKVGSA
ncbi:hypothetical protein F4818DRAFT_73340 [Hypoxylon cercidicola]|nr:hypothetical protein F4818DRAFT_73340 [Hypoxylon cercidicola]